MPAQSNIVLADSAAANHTFSAAGVSNGIATWLEKTSGVITGYFKMSMSMKLPVKSGDPVRHQLKMIVPTTATETINGVTRNIVTRQCLIDVSVVIAPDATLTERKDIVEYVRRMLDASVNPTLNFYNQVANNDPTT